MTPLIKELSNETDAEIRRRFLRLAAEVERTKDGWQAHLLIEAFEPPHLKPTHDEQLKAAEREGFARGQRDALASLLRMAKGEV